MIALSMILGESMPPSAVTEVMQTFHCANQVNHYSKLWCCWLHWILDVTNDLVRLQTFVSVADDMKLSTCQMLELQHRLRMANGKSLTRSSAGVDPGSRPLEHRVRRDTPWSMEMPYLIGYTDYIEAVYIKIYLYI